MLAAFANLAISILPLAGMQNIQNQMDFLLGDPNGTFRALMPLSA